MASEAISICAAALISTGITVFFCMVLGPYVGGLANEYPTGILLVIFLACVCLPMALFWWVFVKVMDL